MAEIQISTAAVARHGPIVCKEPKTVSEAIERHRAAFAALGKVLEDADDYGAMPDRSGVVRLESAMNAEVAARETLLACPATTMADVRAKARYLLDRTASLFDTLAPEDCMALLTAEAGL